MKVNEPSPRRRTARIAAVIAVALGVAAVCIVLATSGGGSARAAQSSQKITTASVSTIRSALVAQLRHGNLSFHWVVCLRNDKHFEGVSIVRCNVDFGDPHIQAYCAVLRAGRLLTNYQDPAIPCREDGAGNTQTIIQYG